MSWAIYIVTFHGLKFIKRDWEGTILIIRWLNQEWSGDGFLFCPCMNDISISIGQTFFRPKNYFKTKLK